MRKSLITVASFQTLTLAAAATVKNLVVFGDSNSDVGNSQRWSDGPLWSEYLAVGWNASLYSYAFSGSVCDNEMYNSISSENRVPSLKDQMEAYYNLKLDLNPEETVYAFWFGTQDIFEMAKRHGRQELDYKEITECIGQQLRLARKAFLSDRFLLLNVPPLGYMPYYAEQNIPEIALNRSQASAEINKGLEKDVANLNKHHHALEMDFVDISSLINDIIADPHIFNFKNPTTSYLDECSDKSKSAGCAAKEYIWWDKTHFTTAFHKLIAKSIIEAESYMPKIKITKTIEKQLEDPKSKFHSKIYTVPTSNNGVIEEIARLYDIEKSKPTDPVQPPLEDDTEDVAESADYLAFTESHTSFKGLFIILLIIGGLIIWIKFPHIFRRGGDRGGKFIPVRAEDV